MSDLTPVQRRYLRGRGHALKPVIQVGQQGLTAAVLAEAVRALADHELIKVRVQAADRNARDALIAELTARSGGTLVGRVGHVALLFRPAARLTRYPLPASDQR
ncbi:MAG TPA: YhbY family RNA-binding protein [Steroidobacteraceae bacterium]|nr:YhbY family RNA-binding protein [Steroidobacteraceae bacterium]